MAGNILTPVSLWNGFKIEENITAETVEVIACGDVTITCFYITGRTLTDGAVKIYCESAVKNELKLRSALLVVPSVENGIDRELLVKLAEEGYQAISVDYSGEREDKTNFTVYPPSRAYADYKNSKGKLYALTEDVDSTCWYEWDCVMKYALSYVCSLKTVISVGALGIGLGSTILWHVCANESRLSAAAFVMDSGWHIYKGFHKFGKEVPEMFSDEKLKILAGIEAQAYSPYVKCHVLSVVPTNNADFDVDRAGDTMARVGTGIYSAIDYSVNQVECVDKSAFEDVLVFFRTYLNDGKKGDKNLPLAPELKCEIAEGKFLVTVKSEDKEEKTIRLYVAEQTVNPAERAWECADEKECSDSEAVLSYTSDIFSENLFYFVKTKYKQTGYTVSTGVFCKKNAKSEKSDSQAAAQNRVIFSGRNKLTGTVFAPLYKNVSRSLIDFNGDGEISIKKGPMDIDGIYCKNGLITYKINNDKDKPKDDAILLCDVYVKEDRLAAFTLVSGEEEKTEYTAYVSLNGGNVWHNVKIPLSKFKSAEGRLLKGFESVTALAVKIDGEYLINNLLWV